MSKLTPKQKRFVQEYLIDLNGKQAAIRAGYSKNTAESQASTLLRNPKVQTAVIKGKKRIADKLEVTAERVIAEYAKLAFLDPSVFFTEDGDLLPIQDMPKDAVAAIGGFEVVTMIKRGKTDDETSDPDYLKKVKLIDKKGALDSLSRHLGLFEADNKQQKDDIKKVQIEFVQAGGKKVEN